MSGLLYRGRETRTGTVLKSAKDASGLANSDLPVVIALSLMGLLLTLYVMRRFPELGALIAQYNQF